MLERERRKLPNIEEGSRISWAEALSSEAITSKGLELDKIFTPEVVRGLIRAARENTDDFDEYLKGIANLMERRGC